MNTLKEGLIFSLLLGVVAFLGISLVGDFTTPEAVVAAEQVAEIDGLPIVMAGATPSEEAAATLGWLAFGTFWFWVSMVAFVIVLFAFIENESGVGATVALVIYGLGLQWLSNVDIFGFIFEDWVRTLIIAASYIGIGVFWSAFKFWWYMGTEVQQIKNQEEDWTIGRITKTLEKSGMKYPEAQTSAKKQYAESGMPRELYDDWNQYVDENSPKASRNKGMIMRAMGYWPISMIWFFIADFVTEVFRKIYYRLSKVYESIAESVKNTAKKK